LLAISGMEVSFNLKRALANGIRNRGGAVMQYVSHVRWQSGRAHILIVGFLERDGGTGQAFCLNATAGGPVARFDKGDTTPQCSAKSNHRSNNFEGAHSPWE
jgi:hypothetical protein